MDCLQLKLRIIALFGGVGQFDCMYSYCDTLVKDIIIQILRTISNFKHFSPAEYLF